MLTYHFQIGLSREKELEYVKLLNKNSFGVQLIASFNNGIVSKLVAGKPLDDENVIDKMADKRFCKVYKCYYNLHHSYANFFCVFSGLFLTNALPLLLSSRAIA